LPRRDRTRGAIALALVAALIFGATTPAASVLARSVSPLWLSAALYAGVACVIAFARFERRSLARADVPWLFASALVGGVAAPVLLVLGLRATDAATASLLLATEPVATAAIAWLVVREHASRRTVAGMACIALGAIVLAWRGSPTASLGALAVVGAATCWGIDNNLARRIASSNAIAVVKGAVAASVAIAIAIALHDPRPAVASFGLGALLGLVGYGCSLVLYVRALRVLGTARTGAYFATAPFAGAVLALAFGYAPLGIRLVLAGALMALGVWLHATEHHEHEHVHPAEEHEHWHAHDDEHHLHAHAELDATLARAAAHAHVHTHERIAHVHAHTPDEEHRHSHDPA
jgi:drug/metabolite transporter (DMT)-like permease